MRMRWLVGALVGASLLVGCKSKAEPPSGPDPAALQAQKDLLAKRDQLLQSRQKLQDEKTQITTEIESKKAAGADISELDKKLAEITAQLEGVRDEQERVSEQAIAQATPAAIDVTAGVAAREAQMAKREAAVKDREAAIAQREAALAVREKETCGGGGGTTTIIQQVAPPAKGEKYTKANIDPLLTKAGQTMNRKGLLASDLPGPAQALQQEAIKAMAAGDFGAAYLAASQYLQNVEAIEINQAFVRGKVARLNARIKSAKLDDATSKAVTAGAQAVTQLYGDGQYVKANAMLNDLFSKVR